VPERDAFGREIGEDSLQGLRGEDAAPPPAAKPAPAPAAPAPVAPSSSPGPRPARPPSSPTFPTRRRSGPGLWRLVPVLIVVAVAGVIIVSASHTVSSVTHAFKGITVPDFHVPSPPSTPVPGPAPTGLTGRSMLRPANLRHALALLRSGPGGHVKFLRVAPDRVDAQLVASAGRLELLQVTPDSDEPTRVSVSAGGVPVSDTLPLRGIDPAAPARLIRAAARRSHVRPGSAQYAVLLQLAGVPRWTVVLGDGGGQWLGDAHGRPQQRI
jgi:hypothetical protein